MDTPALITRLKELKAIQEAGFKSQQACITWSNEVAPLLMFNEDFHDPFLEKAAYVNTIGLSANLQGTALNFMVSVLQQAIVALEHGPIASPPPEVIPLQLPAQMTLAWLWHHVPVPYAVTAVAFVVGTFLAGIAFSQTKAYVFVVELATNFVSSTTATPASNSPKKAAP